MRNLHRFMVQGKGRFPFGMLASGRCWPATRGDAQDMASLTGRRLIRLESHQEFDADCWKNLGWPVADSSTKTDD